MCAAVFHSVGWWTDTDYIRTGETLQKEAERFSEKSVNIHQSTRRHILEIWTLKSCLS